MCHLGPKLLASFDRSLDHTQLPLKETPFGCLSCPGSQVAGGSSCAWLKEDKAVLPRGSAAILLPGWCPWPLTRSLSYHLPGVVSIITFPGLRPPCPPECKVAVDFTYVLYVKAHFSEWIIYFSSGLKHLKNSLDLRFFTCKTRSQTKQFLRSFLANTIWPPSDFIGKVLMHLLDTHTDTHTLIYSSDFDYNFPCNMSCKFLWKSGNKSSYKQYTFCEQIHYSSTKFL